MSRALEAFQKWTHGVKWRTFDGAWEAAQKDLLEWARQHAYVSDICLHCNYEHTPIREVHLEDLEAYFSEQSKAYQGYVRNK